MPEPEILRSALREQWHLPGAEITARDGARLTEGWEVTALGERYLARLAERPQLEAGLTANQRLRAKGISAGEPVRTLAGTLTGETACGTLAVLRRAPGRTLDGRDPIDQQFWGDRLGAVHRRLQRFQHPGLRPFRPLDPEAAHLRDEPWLREATRAAATALTRLTVTDRLTYGVLHGDPAPDVFVIDPATGRAGLLDCGAIGVGPLLYDVAAAILYAGGEHTELLDGYLAAGPVTADELHAGLPVLLRYRWAVQADWAARRLFEGAAAGGPYEKRMLSEARRALTSPPGTG